ncbi:MAG: hypothetical protein KA314_20235 [Chloroflexi bacterium]|nr:hypothetical protein [Chloroflexota bacterium]MBP8058167.1 hypothetical protein [Chloroflexota bacterium]
MLRFVLMVEMPPQRARPRFPHSLTFIPWLAGAFCVFIWAWVTGWPVYTLKIDIEQGRLNTALPALDNTVQFQQTFWAGHDGWQEIELIMVRYGEAVEGERGRVFLDLLNSMGTVVAQTEWSTADIRHNDTRHFRFPPQPGGQTYTLVLRGEAGNTVSVWGYDQDVLAGGTFTATGVDSSVDELRFITRYGLTLPEAISWLGQTLWRHGPFFLLTLVFLWLPGLFLQQMAEVLLRSRTIRKGLSHRYDIPTRLALALVSGLSFWSLLWLWAGWLGLRWQGWVLWFILAVMAVMGLWRVVGKREQFAGHRAQSFTIHHGLLFLILLLGFAGRLLALRDLAFPPWVDSSRHGLMTAVMAAKGQFLSDYVPFLEVVRTPYHYGFHTLAASLQMMTGRDVVELLLWLGPLLNGLMPLALYAAAMLLTRRQVVANAAAFLVALPFFFPAYYATWGRFTQLTGMLILPVLVGLTWHMVRIPVAIPFNRAGLTRYVTRLFYPSAVIALGAAGLFLVHLRVFLLYIPFVVVLLLWQGLALLGRFSRAKTPQSAIRPLMARGNGLLWPFAAASLGALLLITPRLFALFRDPYMDVVFTGGPEGYNDFPYGYFTTGWERYFVYGAMTGLVVAVGAGVWRRRWAREPIILGLWVGFLFLLVGGRQLGLPPTWVINTNALAISLFLPIALLLATTGERVWRWGTRPHWLRQVMGLTIMGGWFAAATLFGLERQSNILNEQTILARPADIAGLHWVAQNLPADALIAVNSWRWLGSTWAGSDGGAWIVPLTGLQTTTPPADYIYSDSLDLQVKTWNEQLMGLPDWSTDNAAAYLRLQGITHLFIGQRGGFLDPSTLLKNPNLTVLYHQDGVFVFAVNQE